jgi:hypothetical protein
MPGRSGVTVVTNSCVYLLYTRGCGRSARPAFPAPSDFQMAGNSLANSGACREIVKVCLRLEQRHCEERSDEAIHSFFLPLDGLLRYGSQ